MVSNANGSSAAPIARTLAGGSGMTFGYEYMNPT
jgi:hypothetical protein